MQGLYVLNLKKKKKKSIFRPVESSLVFRTETEERQPRKHRIFRQTIVFKTIEAKSSSYYPRSLTRKNDAKKSSREGDIRKPKQRYRDLETSIDAERLGTGKWLSFQQRSNGTGIQDIFKRLRQATERRKRYGSLQPHERE